MKIQKIPTKEGVLEDLKDLIPLVWIALEAGINHAKDYFAHYSVPFENQNSLASHLTRSWAKHTFDSLSQKVEFEREPISNDGLFLDSESYHVRILKSDAQVLPVPGSSVRAQFYRQAEQLEFHEWDDSSDEAQARDINLVFLWGTDSSYRTLDLTLACPRDGRENERDSVKAHWYVKLEHPATTIRSPQEPTPSPEGDLPISLTKEKTGEGA